MYDQRLFNQEGGLASGLEADDSYNTYDKPLFADRGSNLYRAPARAADDEAGADDEAAVRTEKFKPDRVRARVTGFGDPSISVCQASVLSRRK